MGLFGKKEFVPTNILLSDKSEKKFLKAEKKIHKAQIEAEIQVKEKKIQAEKEAEYHKVNLLRAKELDEDTKLQLEAIREKVENIKQITCPSEKITSLISVLIELNSIETEVFLETGAGLDAYELPKSENYKNRLEDIIENIFIEKPTNIEETKQILSIFRKDNKGLKDYLSDFSWLKKYRNDVARLAREQYPEDDTLQELVNSIIGKPIDPDSNFFVKCWKRVVNTYKENT